MANISQILSASYPAVLAEMRKPANQWSENGFLRELERQGGIKKVSLGPTIEVPLDYQVNPSAEFLASELSSVSLSKTEVITTASFTPAELSVAMVWSKRDEATNPSDNQKIALVKAIIENGVNSHDDRIENAFFAAAAVNGFGTLPVYFPTTGQGTIGTIDSSTSTWWRNQQTTYVDDTDIESAMTTGWNSATKGSGSTLSPTLAVSDSATQALFEGTQQANQRYVDTDELKAGFKILGFKTARYVFSQYASTSIYMFNPKVAYLVASKEYFRQKGDTQEIDNANGFSQKIYSALQFATSNKSRVVNVHL